MEGTKRPNARQFFDQNLCPICRARLLSRDDFKWIPTTMNLVEALYLSCTCHQTFLVGIVLYGTAETFEGNPCFILGNCTQIRCLNCGVTPANQDEFSLACRPLDQGFYRLNWTCHSCGTKTHLAVWIRTHEGGEIPKITADGDPLPARLIGAPSITEDEVLDVCEELLKIDYTLPPEIRGLKI